MSRHPAGLVWALIAWLGGCTATEPFGLERRSPFVAVIERASPAVVAVSGPQGSLGTGFQIDAAGHVLTAAHVVRAAGEHLRIRAGERDHAAKLVAIDEEQDLALLSVDDLRNLSFLELDAAVIVGEWIVVLGNPFGAGITAAVGIAGSAPGALQRPRALKELIQLDAAVNPGNSGGPVLNLQGRVIGMATAAVAGGAGIGFAIPSDRLRAFLARGGVDFESKK